MSTTAQVEFWFDATCPWTWVTAQWMKEVTKVRDIEVAWRPFSLFQLNDGRDLPSSYREHINRTVGVPRVTMAVAEQFPEKLEEFYFALGRLIHNESKKDNDYRDALAGALDQTGLPADLIDNAETDDLDEKLQASTDAGLQKVGDDVGVPIVSLDDTAFFGPVLSKAPTGEEAGQVFDGAVALAKYPGFYELKRTRNDVSPEFL
ncbi:DsbA family protein [Rothia sp. LK2588]|uniref:mycothiol-dependent nitroreductase Rv2466c family protein n=1 Tax=Rothia sp. LK2588 TaxID=3114369 RepID=UPI0034CFAE94